MTDYGYSRTNRPDADLEAQHRALREAGIDQGFIVSDEVVSGLNRDGQTQLTKLLASVRSGDTVVVDHLYRLGRSASRTSAILAELKDRGVTVHVTSHDFDSDSDSDSAIVQARCASGGCQSGAGTDAEQPAG